MTNRHIYFWLIPVLTILISLFSGLCNDASGQQNSYGAKAGFQSTGIYSDPAIIGRENGMNFFLFYDMGLSEMFSLEQNLGYIQRGYRYTQVATDDDGNYITDVTAISEFGYISYSPQIHFQHLTPDHVIAFIAFGPRFEYMVSKSAGAFNFQGARIQDTIAANFDNFAIGISISTGLKLVDVGDLNLRFAIGYDVDITDSISGVSDRYARNNAIFITFGLGN